MTCFVPESPIFSRLPFHQLPENHRSGDCINRSRTRVTRIIGSFCGEQPSVRRCPPIVWGSPVAYPALSSLFLCLWGTAVCATLSSRSSRGLQRAETRRERVDTIFLFLSSSCNTNTRSCNVYLVKLCTLHYFDIICNWYRSFIRKHFFLPSSCNKYTCWGKFFFLQSWVFFVVLTCPQIVATHTMA